MSTQLDPQKITRLLTQSTQQLDESTITALVRARHNALAVQPARAPAFAATTGRWTENVMPHTTMQWLATGLLIALLSVAGASFWQHSNEQQISELDVAILADEMPLDVFID
jgi:cytochrome c biogenesis protein ResB